jgi:hypothetical protein
MKEKLLQIKGELQGIEYEDLTTAEKKIWNIVKNIK